MDEGEGRGKVGGTHYSTQLLFAIRELGVN
jgi:hypothetical protein